ncbi:hypothetical protein PHISCL_02021 [Aspergillus sclerotialis]|uniref:Uncharacterized protein n=1 Tax=Aspergillus sclerotialis TaxID=2070753 RepID=A0A3A2ZR47_9EURO|nr:hypothetical protein PHISCL_02021 [Aspergillus sclerotialis]
MFTYASVIVKHGTIFRSRSWRIAHNSRRQIRLKHPRLIDSAGNKKDNITIIYTPWSNLLKDGSMQTGQVSFHNPKLVRKVFVQERENAIINRLNKTRVAKSSDLRAEKEEFLKKKQREERKVREEQRVKERQAKKEREQLKWQKEHAYDDLLNEESVQQSSNQNRDPNFLDDFM